MACTLASEIEPGLLDDAIKYSLEKIGKKNLVLKSQQKDALREIVNGRDVLAVLPTGFGKSIIFQLLPFIFDFLSGEESGSLVIVISPLNGLIRDQIEKLKRFMAVGVLQANSYARDYDENAELPEPRNTDQADTLSKYNADQLSKFQLLFAHPEVFVDSKKVLKMFTHEKLQKRVKSIAIDEAHLISEWKDFRPAYTKLGLMSTIFPHATKLSLTATATYCRKKEICDSLGLINPSIIEVNPDRPNIYFSATRRPNRGDDRLVEILSPFVNELRQKKVESPKTLFYGSMETIAECYMYFSNQLGMGQYYPVGADACAANRLFTQYHAQYPLYEQERILKEVVRSDSVIRFLFVTVAFGMGIDCPDIRRVIHIGPPRTMEEYFQEAGRAGRDGHPAEAIIFYNSYDISKSKKNMQEVMRTLVTSTECRRKTILSHFGYSVAQPSSPSHLCCDIHKQSCNCSTCFSTEDAEVVPDIQNLTISGSQTEANEGNVSGDISLDYSDTCTQVKLYHELLAYRYKLVSGRSCVGSLSLSTGFSNELIDGVLKLFDELHSVENIMELLPVYSRANAEAIFLIVCKYK